MSGDICTIGSADACFDKESRQLQTHSSFSTRFVVHTKEYLLEFSKRFDGRIAVYHRKVIILHDNSAAGLDPAIHLPKCQNRIVQVHQQEPSKHQVKVALSMCSKLSKLPSTNEHCR